MILATALRKAGLHVEVHDDHFPPDTRDEAWLTEIGRRGWIVLTKDQRLRYHRIEIDAIRRFSVRAFVLTTGDLQAVEMADVFLKALPTMRKFLGRHGAPFVAGVSKGGRVALLT